MLERTAASLDAGQLGRVLSRPVRRARRPRKLHTGFWQHGASALEISSLWLASDRPCAADQDVVGSLPQPLLASAFLLDFLYPSGTHNLLRRLYPSLQYITDADRSKKSPRGRHFTSSSFATESELPRSSDGPSNVSITRESDESSISSIQNTQHAVTATTTGREASNRDARFSALAKELSKPERGGYNDVWDAYRRLEEVDRNRLRSQMVIYLSASSGIVEVGRAITLFRQIPCASWDEALQAAGVLLFLRAGDKAAAIDVFYKGLQSADCGSGLEYLLEDAIVDRSWPVVLKVWLEFCSACSKSSSWTTDAVDLAQLEKIPNLSKLYFAFERYLEAEGADSVKAINLYSHSRLALRAIREKIGDAALRQTCSPGDAKIILQIRNDPRLYNKYLELMLSRWEKGLESRASLTGLPQIYDDFRTLGNTTVSVPVLRGMFKFFYPEDTAGLQQVYLDWHRAWGDLDQEGFAEFLKFYASTGDVQAVKDLWARYVDRFPDMLSEPRGFRSLMNVFAQTGDTVGAEQALRAMTEEYGVKPDVHIRNSLLKCYVNANDADNAQKCFKDIKDSSHPNSFTFAHVMTMAAKKGDLGATLHLYDESQREGVLASKEMVMALVLAYCRNDRLADAEKICVEFSERGVTSAAVWNQLVYNYGMHNKLNKCYRLLQTMKYYNLEWDSQTHTFLLQALVHANQVQSAYQLLRKADQGNLFPVEPEHFAMVLSGAVRTRQLGLAQTILSQMQASGRAIPFKAHVSLVEAAYKHNPSAARTRTLAMGLLTHMRAMLPTSRAQGDCVSWTAPAGPIQLSKATGDIGRAMTVLIELREFPAVEELVTMYTTGAAVTRDAAGLPCFPPEIASALMLGYLRDGKLDRVQTMWRTTVDAALNEHRDPCGQVYPAHRYDLCRPLNIAIKAFRQANDGIGLLSCLDELTTSGFKLTRTNWNLAVRSLAELEQWERAMSYCEEMLMPHWRGWGAASYPSSIKASSQLSAEERREMKSPRVLVASRETVLSLQGEWLKLRRLAAWSAQVSSSLQDVEQRHPRLHRAFITIDYEHLGGAWVLPKRESLNKAIKAMLRPLSHDELKAMKKALEKQLRAERTKRLHRVGRHQRSPFQTVDGPKHTRAVGVQDLKALDEALTLELDSR